MLLDCRSRPRRRAALCHRGKGQRGSKGCKSPLGGIGFGGLYGRVRRRTEIELSCHEAPPDKSTQSCLIGGQGRHLEEILLQAGVEFLDEGDAIGVRVVRQAKTRTHELKKRKPRGPKKSV